MAVDVRRPNGCGDRGMEQGQARFQKLDNLSGHRKTRTHGSSRLSGWGGHAVLFLFSILQMVPVHSAGDSSGPQFFDPSGINIEAAHFERATNQWRLSFSFTKGSFPTVHPRTQRPHTVSPAP